MNLESWVAHASGEEMVEAGGSVVFVERPYISDAVAYCSIFGPAHIAHTRTERSSAPRLPSGWRDVLVVPAVVRDGREEKSGEKEKKFTRGGAFRLILNTFERRQIQI